MTLGDLRAAFARVRHDFFPRWDRGRRWKVAWGRHAEGSREDGFCDPERRVILVAPRGVASVADDVGLSLLLIHEITHAVAGLGHGKQWLLRMQGAYDRALLLGMEALGDRIADEMIQYHRPPESAAHVYSGLTDALLDAPNATDEVIIALVANDCGFTRDEFVRRYPRAHRVLAAARGDFAQMRRTSVTPPAA